MAERTVHAVVLRRRDAGESDRRLTLLTEEHGVLDAIAKGARKGGSRLSGSTEPLSASILQLTEGKRAAYVTQAQPISSFPGLRADYERLTYGLALAELAATVLPHEQPAPEEFRFMVHALHDMELHPKPLVVLVWAELRLLELSGFAPLFGECVLTGVPVKEEFPFLSPMAGGYVAMPQALECGDRVQTRAEVLYGLAAMQLVDAPPSNLKFADEALQALYPFWRHIADRPLLANEAVLAHAKAERS